jgi:hypothetical protein
VTAALPSVEGGHTLEPKTGVFACMPHHFQTSIKTR